MKLVIVESPAKAKTIEKILGKDYTVTSSFGHIRDLAKDGYKNTGVEIDNKYKPHYVIPDEKKKVANQLKRMVKKYTEVILATDEDREGEAISWHLKEVLKLKDSKTKRITFTEITPHAIEAAVKKPRKIDSDLVDAQQARRILDRLVGFELTGLLWKKIRGKLSAGRVQSVAVKLIVEKERDIKAFKPDKYYKVTGEFKPEKGDSFYAELSDNIASQKATKSFLEDCAKATYTIDSIDEKPSTRKPPAPFTTSTLQQIASQKLGYSVTRTMVNAQKLYEAGHITYMRTDSISLSNTALGSINNYIKKEYGDTYAQVRKFRSKSKSAQEAHEAIRPTYIDKEVVASNPDQQKLYQLIRLRTLASQMADAKIKRTTVKITISNSKKYHFVAKGEVIDFDGFLKLYKKFKFMKVEENILPELTKGDGVEEKYVQALERMTKPPARYTEATLVKKLEELGIGRPSTYAPTISKITAPSRGYVTKESRDGEPVDYALYTLKKGKVIESVQSEIFGAQKNKLFASDMGLIVTDFLEEHFDSIMDYAFTAEVEDKLDEVASGKVEWRKILDAYYKPFTKNVSETMEKAERASGERELGKDPKSKQTLLVRMSKYGPVAQIGTEDELKEDEKPQYANLMPDQSLETITREEALKLFELPKELGTYQGDTVTIGRGRYGPYVKFDKTYVSIPKDIDPFAITMKQAQELIKQKKKENEPIGKYEDLPITKGKGRFGPYVKWNNKFVSISKKSGYELETITEKQATELIKAKNKKDKERIIQRWDDEKLTIMKGRWGPFIKKDGKRKMYSLPKGKDGKRMTPEEAKKLSLEEVKKILSNQK